jgi:hypothetical protein
VGRIRTLIIGAGIAFLVSGLLDSSSKPGSEIDLDGLLTMAFLVYIWYTLRWAASSKNRQKPPVKPSETEQQNPLAKSEQESDSAPHAGESNIIHIRKKSEQPGASEPEKSTFGPQDPDLSGPDRTNPGVGDSIPNLLGSLRGEATKIIHHKAPWAIVERGATVGRFRNAPIPAWILTSDNRKADYNGITDDPSLDGAVCTEIPERSELILPPGLVYLLRS